MQPLALLACSVALLAFLATQTVSPDAPLVSVGQASNHVGDLVRLEGTATDVVATPPWSFQLRNGTAALRVMQDPGMVADAVGVATSPHDVPRPGLILVEGALVRENGMLVLKATAFQQTTPAFGAAPQPAASPARTLPTQAPDDLLSQPVHVIGKVSSTGFQAGGSGPTIRRGTGSWPRSGVVDVTGTVRYDNDCFCYRLDAWTVAPVDG